jgi:hypothetical protein
MGAWGYKSYENDHVMDEIPYSFTEYKQATSLQIERTLKKVFNPKRRFYNANEKREARLGVIVYFLETNEHPYPYLVIGNKYLRQAVTIARNLKKDKNYLSYWNNGKARKNRLEKEIKLIQKAQKDYL